MKSLAALSILALSIFASACSRLSGETQQRPAWKTGFWLWAGAAIDSKVAGDQKFDLLYVQTGVINKNYVDSTSWSWQTQLPAATEYWALWRYEPPLQPTDTQIQLLARDFGKRKGEAEKQGHKLIGIQLDYDCATDDLRGYASFLDQLRQALPPETRISITALLDWFRPGTRIRDVLSHVDEYVPQFYDVGTAEQGGTPGIAEPLNPSRWGPVFNSFRVPYRIGISAFGRIQLKRGETIQFFRDLAPLDIQGNAGLTRISTAQTPAGEQQVILRVREPVWLGYHRPNPGDQIEWIMPTRKSAEAAYKSAKTMGGFCAGVVFFRWPARDETLVLNPEQLMGWISNRKVASAPPSLSVEEGNCVALHCWDLQARIFNSMPDHPVAYVLHISSPLEYFLPDRRIRLRAVTLNRRAIRIALPAYHGARTLYLGRAVTAEAAQFRIEEAK